jgi:hypothetical protein
MKGVKKVISILVRIISIARMKLLMLPKAKKPDHFACKMGFRTSFLYETPTKGEKKEHVVEDIPKMQG